MSEEPKNIEETIRTDFDMMFELTGQAFGSPGGKSKVASKLLAMFPEHKIYVEPFAGGAALFWKKPKEDSQTEVLNDLNPEIAFAYRYIQSMTSDSISNLKKYNWMPNKSKFFKLRDKTQFSCDSERFYRFLYVLYHSYGRNMSSYGYQKKAPSFERMIKLTPRLSGVKIHSEDYRAILRKYDSPETFFFIDPPYPEEWHKKDEQWTYEQVQEMANLCKKLKGKYLITFNNSKENRKIFKDFNCDKFLIARTFRHGMAPQYELLASNYKHREHFENIDFGMTEARISKYDKDKFREFTLVDGFISIVPQEKKGKISLSVRMDPKYDFFNKAISIKLKKLNDSSNPICEPLGPEKDSMPLYDLVLRPRRGDTMNMSDNLSEVMEPFSPFKPMVPKNRFYDLDKIVGYMFN